MFYKDMSVKITTEEPEFPDIFSFFASLGGAFSLWLGTSIVDIFEVFELVIRLFFTIFNYMYSLPLQGVLEHLHNNPV